MACVDHRRRRQRVPRLLFGQLCAGQFSQFVVDDRQRLIGCERVASVDRLKHLGECAFLESPSSDLTVKRLTALCRRSDHHFG